MTVGELIEHLGCYDKNTEVEIDQFFDTNQPVMIRSIEVVKGKVILKDHHTTFQTTIMTFDGAEYEMNPFDAKLTVVVEAA